jgi:hypothetical protein
MCSRASRRSAQNGEMNERPDDETCMGHEFRDLDDTANVLDAASIAESQSWFKPCRTLSVSRR